MHPYSIKYCSSLLKVLTQYYGVSCRLTGAALPHNLETYERLLTGRKFKYAMSIPHFFNVGNTRACRHFSANRPDSNDMLFTQVITGNSTSRTCRITDVGFTVSATSFPTYFW